MSIENVYCQSGNFTRPSEFADPKIMVTFHRPFLIRGSVYGRIKFNLVYRTNYCSL